MIRQLSAASVLLLGLSVPVIGQTMAPPVSCVPSSERADRPYGCFVLGSVSVGTLGASPAFWQLEAFSTLDAATREE